ncbi:MAG: class I SAM-dependent methyltransferase [Rhodospirillaceae bacterium]|nr:class I SAM-dependent methyltransferase [Rhodospirillaceae bacterium]MBT5459571.1 class I SAM-dependent methyltransferase [Rhodospirillaceae bacterium]MBT7756735.1 class I SAM-dependent methyltransferase [Rhodospirillaceae bacterium]
METDNFSAHLLGLLRCPQSHDVLQQQGQELVTASGGHRYKINEHNIPLFAEQLLTPEARAQQQHYDRLAEVFVENLGYPHTEVYIDYLDWVLLDEVGANAFGVTAEICCGRGETAKLLGRQIDEVVGLDVSSEMLSHAEEVAEGPPFVAIQGDATRMPLASNAFDTVVILGGIHHVNDRAELFAEIFRILRPGGLLIYREPVSDFFLWKMIRAVIYRLSPSLDHDTERPLVWEESVPLLQTSGFVDCTWRTCGFLGFCFFMNSDILVFNRLFRFIPGIRQITKVAARFDEWVVSLKPLKRAGLVVVGTARKPE